MQYRRDIEGLRALAVIAVLLFHFGVPGLGGGFVGVDVFFVVSGYLITSLLVDERVRTGRVSILRFYARRARRLLPISTTVLVVTAALGVAALQVTRLPSFRDDLVGAAAFAANLLFAHRGTDYLASSIEPSPLLHYWSLAVEEQFYVLWPALIALLTIGATGTRVVRRRLATAMTVVVLASFAASTLLTSSQPTWSYFGLHTRAWELGLGAALAVAGSAVDRVPRSVRAAAGWFGLGAIAVAVVTFGDVDVFPGWAAAVPVVGTVAVLAAGDTTPGSPAAVLRLPPLTYVGTRSYSLYLWHWPALILAEAFNGAPLDAWTRVALMGLVAVVAEVGYRTIEQPVRHAVILSTHPRRAVALGGALVTLGVLTGAATSWYRPDLDTGVVAAAPAPLASTTTTPSTSAPPLDESTTSSSTSSTLPALPAFLDMSEATPLDAILDALDVEVAPDNLRPSVVGARDDVPEIYDDGCHAFLQSSLPDGCSFGDPDSDITIALWGDSHAAQWFTAVDAMATARGWRLLSMTQGGCPVMDIDTFNVSADAVLTNCAPWRAAVIDRMKTERVDVVLLSQHYGLWTASERSPIPASMWSDMLPPLIIELRAAGIEPIILGDSPDPPSSVPACVADHRSDVMSCAIQLPNTRFDDIDNVIRRISDELEVGFFEPRRLLCTATTCPPIIGDILVYRDGHHLSDVVVEWLAPVVDQLLGPAIVESLNAR